MNTIVLILSYVVMFSTGISVGWMLRNDVVEAAALDAAYNAKRCSCGLPHFESWTHSADHCEAR